MDTQCMPIRTVSMSSHDLLWMTPFLNSMIRTKYSDSSLRKDRLRVIKKRIADIISQNKREFMAAPPGSRAWFKRVDELSQGRRASCGVNMDNSCLVDLNGYLPMLFSNYA